MQATVINGANLLPKIKAKNNAYLKILIIINISKCFTNLTNFRYLCSSMNSFLEMLANLLMITKVVLQNSCCLYDFLVSPHTKKNQIKNVKTIKKNETRF